MHKPTTSVTSSGLIGTVSYTHLYRQYIEKDAALERRFQPVMVNEPTVEDTISIPVSYTHLMINASYSAKSTS